MKKSLFAALLICSLAFISAPAKAAVIDLDFSGNLFYANDVAYHNFSMAEAGQVTLFSSSYGYPDGGFDLAMALWYDATGAFIGYNDDGDHTDPSAISNAVVYSLGILDFYLNVDLEAGNYLVTINHGGHSPVAATAGGGFLSDGFANQHISTPIDADRNHYAFHITGVTTAHNPNPAPTPEPGTILLMGLGLAGLAAVRRFRK